MWRGVGRYGEGWGDVKRGGEMWGGGRCGGRGVGDVGKIIDMYEAWGTGEWIKRRLGWGREDG